jgi:hypothetical protein
MDEQSKNLKNIEQSPPVSSSVSVSSNTCSLTGEPPFTITTTYECITSHPISALIYQNSEWGNGAEIRDPERRCRRVGPTSIRYCTDGWEDEDWDRYEIEDSILLRMEPGQKFSTCYVVSAETRMPGFGSDMRSFKENKTYKVTLRERTWRWMYEDEMGDLDWNGRIETLKSVKKMRWKVDCSTTFSTVI